MKVLLVFPPDWLPSEPYLSLPMLASVLRQGGHEVILKDINVEMYDMMFSPPFLQYVYERILTGTPRLQKAFENRPQFDEHKKLLSRILSHKNEFFARLGEDVESAKNIFRSKDFYHIDRLEWATECLHYAMFVISLGFFPAQICFPPMETDLTYKTYISGDILKATGDDTVNVYRYVYRRLVEPVIVREMPTVVGISVVQKKQIIPALTFCRMIKERHPNVHVTVGGNIITRIRDVIAERPEFFSLFDTAILYEGEYALLDLVNAINGNKRDFSPLPNLIYKGSNGVRVNTNTRTADITALPPPDFDGLPLEKYFAPNLILPYLATRGCYWGRCSFCDHSQGYAERFRTKTVDQVVEDISFLKNKYGNRHFHFTDESYPPALFKKLPQKLIERNLDIAWTTHLRFEDGLREETIWKRAAESGCKSLYFGYESGNARILKLMNKATDLATIKTILKHSAKHGIWNHCMGFFGFPGETREEAYDSIRFLHENKDAVHSVGFMAFVLGKHSPIAQDPDRHGISVYKNPEWDAALDYYFTTKEGQGIDDALKTFEEFERNHDPKWDLRIGVREYVFLYVDHFQTNNLPQLYVRPFR